MSKAASLPAARQSTGQGLPEKCLPLTLYAPPTPLTHPTLPPTTPAFGPCHWWLPYGPFGLEWVTCVPDRSGLGSRCAHLCGVGSHGVPWQEPQCQELPARRSKQWEPALIGKTQQDRAWRCSQRRTGQTFTAPQHTPTPFWMDFH